VGLGLTASAVRYLRTPLRCSLGRIHEPDWGQPDHSDNQDPENFLHLLILPKPYFREKTACSKYHKTMNVIHICLIFENRAEIARITLRIPPTRFELVSPAPKAGMIDRYTTGVLDE
jgi:hypothetical protein